MSQTTTKNWWESQGFYLGLVMLFGSFWGLSEDAATSIVTGFSGLIAAGAFVIQFFKTSKFKGFAEILKNGNTWVYLTGILGQFLPNAGELVEGLRGVSDAFLSKNLGAILTALFAFGVMAWNIFFKKKD